MWSVRQWAEKDQPVNLGAPPDSGYYYSGGGANLAAAVLSMAAKKPYAELVRKYVSEPLGLCSLQMDQAWNKPSHRAFGYVARSDPTYASRGPNSCSECTDATMHDLSWDGGGSAFMSTIDDLTAYGQALLSDTTWLTPAERTTLGWTSFVVADADKYRRAYSFDPNSYSFDQVRWSRKGTAFGNALLNCTVFACFLLVVVWFLFLTFCCTFLAPPAPSPRSTAS